ncbi:hypothetical protein G7Y79_00010g028890 [Physcia stellaris]|nr:hypothetical protein G7Y79_00010g028890 [Physcia stellaris]
MLSELEQLYNYTVLAIHDCADFHSLSHLSIRQRLDEEGHQEAFAFFDQKTAATHAIWWITTREESSFFTEFWDEDPHTEPIPWVIMSNMLWDIPRIEDCKTYDLHDPQNPPYTFGLNFSKKED